MSTNDSPFSSKLFWGIVIPLTLGGITLIIASVDKIYALWAGVALLVIVVIFTVIWWITWKRRKNKDKQEREHITPEQFEVIAANNELDSLQGDIKQMKRRAGRSDVTAATGITAGSSITVGATAYALSGYNGTVIKGTYSIDANGVLTGTSYPGNITWDAINKGWKRSK